MMIVHIVFGFRPLYFTVNGNTLPEVHNTPHDPAVSLFNDTAICCCCLMRMILAQRFPCVVSFLAGLCPLSKPHLDANRIGIPHTDPQAKGTDTRIHPTTSQYANETSPSHFKYHNDL